MVGADRRFRIATYTSSTGVSPYPMELPLDEVYALLGHEETDCVLADGTPGCIGKKCAQKDGLAWSPGFISDPCRCGTGSRPPKNSGRCAVCHKKTRFAANVESLDLAVFDVDHITQLQLETMCVALEGVELYLHTTHNHLPPGDQGFRLVFPFSRPITPKEWEQIWFAIVRKYELPQEVKKGVDKSTRDPARLSYLPRAFRGRPFINIHQEGVMLDPGALLLENVRYSRQVMAAPRAPVATPEEGSVDLGDLKGFLRRYNPAEDPKYDPESQGRAIIQRVLAGEPLAQKGHRGLTMLRTGSIVGFLLPVYTPFEVALELVRESLSKTPIFGDDNPNENSIEPWTLSIRRGYEGSQGTKAADAADDDSAHGKLMAVMERKKAERTKREWLGEPEPVPASAQAPIAAPEQAASPIPDFGTTPTADFEVVSMTEDADDWRLEKLITTVDKQGFPHPKNTPANITVVLQNHRSWKGVLRYNDLTNEPEAHGGPIPKDQREPERLITAIRNWLAHQEELDLPRFEVLDHVDFVAREHRYDPVRAYLTGLVWDGVPRLRRWLIDYCGARLTDDSGKDVSRYVQMIGEKWLMAGAARGLYPGCKADNVLVFEGLQYAGKSAVLDILGGEWFADTQLNLGDKSTLELASKSWIIELSELATMKKSETEAQKSFFSKRADSFRLSYAPRVRKYPRRCIYAGTTNETRYLLDLTGNRRFWCVWCDKIDIAALRRDRDQVWAEAVAQVRAGETCPNCNGIEDRCSEHRWWLDPNQTVIAEEIAVSRLKADFADEIRTWWLGKEPATSLIEGQKRPDYLTMRDILTRILNLTPDRREQFQTAIGRTMKSLGFVKAHPRINGNQEWVYYPSEFLRLAPREKFSTMTLADLVEEKARATQPMPGATQ